MEDRRLTVDAVVAENLRRLREDRGLSREGLASRLSEVSGAEVSRWRIIDLEGARSKGRAPASASWSEISNLATVLGVTIFDLVLPIDDSRVWVSRATWSEVTDVPEPLRTFTGELVTKVKKEISYGVSLNRDELGKLWFRLPGSSITRENLERISQEQGFSDAIGARLRQIAETQATHSQMLETLSKKQEDLDGIDS